MSDDDFMQESDEGYDFEYEEDEDQDAGDISIENKYYNAKQLKVTEPEDAIVEFLGIPPMEQQKGEWGFKGLKQAFKLEFRLGHYDKATEHYSELLTYVKSAVVRNYSEKSINNMLDFIEKGADKPEAVLYVERLYSLTLDTFQATNNERLWLKTNLKLAKLLLDRRDYNTAARKLRDLHLACKKPDGEMDTAKGTYLLEICALEIQMHSDTRNNKQLKRLYERALKIRSAVPHPKIMGIIRECGGKMHMSDENWTAAQSDFFESFRNFDEAGSLQRIQVLKYLLLTTMLMRSTINPFDSQEIKPYRSDPRIAAMVDLVDAYQHDDVGTYERVLAANGDILNDPFIAENIDEVTRTMRTRAILKLIAPYSRMRLEWISAQMRVPESETRDIIGHLITIGKVKGRISQRDGTLEIDSVPDAARGDALGRLTESVRELLDTLFRDGPGFRAGDFGDDSVGVNGGEETEGGSLRGQGKEGMMDRRGHTLRNRRKAAATSSSATWA